MNNQKDDIENITVGITIFNKERNKVFLKKRDRNELFPEKYCIPGGKIKVGENIDSAIKRELYEETQISVDNLSYIKWYKHENVYLFAFSTIINDENDSFILLEDISGLELAPNISDVIKDSLSFFEKNGFDLNVNILNLANEIIDKIADNAFVIQKKTGWDHFILEKRIGTIGTSIGLKILNNSKSFEHVKKEAYKTLIKSQLNDGGWGVKSSDNKFSITESTCNCVSAIFDYIKKDNESIQNAKKWLAENMLNDYSWGYSKQSLRGRITSTCSVIQTLYKLDSNYSLQENINWLLNAQNRDGGWGFTLNSSSNLTATSIAISTLIIFIHKNDDRILKAIKWIEDNIKKNGIVEESEVEYIGDKRFEFKHSTIVYILNALIKQKGINNVCPTFLYDNLLAIINKRNENGFWEHSLTPGYFPIWHTYNILNLLLLLHNEEELLNLSYIRKIYDNNRIQLDLIKIIEIQYQPNKEKETIIYY